MLYDLILASGARFQVEFDEDPVGPKNITAKASFFAATELQKHLQQSVELQDQLGLCPWEPVSVTPGWQPSSRAPSSGQWRRARQTVPARACGARHETRSSLLQPGVTRPPTCGKRS
jgi:hypothetical protein